jgi:hypothetical protein
MAWFDESQQLRDDLIVAWAYWYTDGTRWVSLHDAQPAPVKGVQVQRVWALRPDDKRHPSDINKRMMYHGNYTGRDYTDPNSKETYPGEWTDFDTHNRIFDVAMRFRI